MFNLQACAAQFQVKQYAVTSTTAAYKILPANPNRVALILSDQTAGLVFGDSTVSYAGGKGMYYYQTGGPVALMLDFEHYGPLVQQEWWGSRLSGTGITVAVEVLYVPTMAVQNV